MSKGGKPFNMPEDQKAKERPTPSKEPSVDELSVDQILEVYPEFNSYHDWKTWAKPKLLALHLGCLPDRKQPLRGIDVQIENAATLQSRAGFNAALDLMEQKLREMYGV